MSEIETTRTDEQNEIICDIAAHSIESRLRANIGDPVLRPGALHTAASQLELLTPTVMMSGHAGIYSSEVAMVRAGVILMILADGPRCTTTLWKSAKGATFAEAIADCVSLVSEPLQPGDALTAVRYVVRRYGAAPGKPAARTAPEHKIHIAFGILFGLLPTAARESLAEALAGWCEHNICPAVVAVIGPSSSGKPATSSFAWPLILPVAPYAERFIERAETIDRAETSAPGHA